MASTLVAEIASQGSEIARLLERQVDPVRRLVRELPPFSYVVVAARGSSDHAAAYARYIWGALAGLQVVSAAPSLHTLYKAPMRYDGALVVGISQSGQSPDVVAVIEEARRQGRPTLALTNDTASPLARVADHVIDLCASPEQSIAATKTYTCQLTAVAMLGAAWAAQPDARFDELLAIPTAVARTLEGAAAPAAQAATRLRDATTVLPIARGINYATACEMALKLRELLRLSTHAFSAADFRHGSIALVTDRLPMALIMPRGAAFADMVTLAGELRARQGDLTVISDDEAVGAQADSFLPLVASVPEWLSPLTAILPAQLLAVELACVKGLDPDRPRGLADKVVRTL